MRDHPEDRPPWPETTLMTDHPSFNAYFPETFSLPFLCKWTLHQGPLLTTPLPQPANFPDGKVRTKACKRKVCRTYNKPYSQYCAFWCKSILMLKATGFKISQFAENPSQWVIHAWQWRGYDLFCLIFRAVLTEWFFRAVLTEWFHCTMQTY